MKSCLDCDEPIDPDGDRARRLCSTCAALADDGAFGSDRDTTPDLVEIMRRRGR